MQKVKVNKEIFEALETTKNWHNWSRTILETYGDFLCERYVLNDLDILLIANIALFGYELELTPEEILKRKYKENYKIFSETEDKFLRGEMASFNDGIVFTLLALGIEIEVDK